MNAQVPIIHYNEAEARKAWQEYVTCLKDEKVARAKRERAYKRFVAAFMGGEQ